MHQSSETTWTYMAHGVDCKSESEYERVTKIDEQLKKVLEGLERLDEPYL